MSNILDDYLSSFNAKCDWALQVYFSTVSIFNENQVNGFTADMKYMVIESVILNVCSSWETFLEDIFIAYMRGNKSKNGSAVTVYVLPNDDEHAYNLIRNVTTYPDWSDISKILINAENFFENGGPFKLLRTLKGDINAVKTIRNAIAHTSKKARENFNNLVRGKIGHVPNDITPARFVSEYKTGPRRADPTFFEYYVSFLKNSASMLVEYQADTGA